MDEAPISVAEVQREEVERVANELRDQIQSIRAERNSLMLDPETSRLQSRVPMLREEIENEEEDESDSILNRILNIFS